MLTNLQNLEVRVVGVWATSPNIYCDLLLEKDSSECSLITKSTEDLWSEPSWEISNPNL